MPDSEDREFIREKIMDKAVGKRHRIGKLVKLLITAVVFGLVASLFFVLGKSFLESHFLPEETPPTDSIDFSWDSEESGTEGIGDPSGTDSSGSESGDDPEASGERPGGNPSEESSPDASENNGDHTGEAGQPVEADPSESTDQEPDPEEVLEQKIREAVDAALTEQLKQQDEYLSLSWYRKVGSLLKIVNKGLVTINGMTEDTDWFNNTVSSVNKSSGAVIGVTDAEVLILTDYEAIREAGALTVTFASGHSVEARIKKSDSITGIAIVSVSKVALPIEAIDALEIVTLGNSYQVANGTPVLAAGNPAGYTGSVMTGMISLIQKNTVGTDTAFQLMYPDIRLAETGGGFLFNVEGEIIGVLTRNYGDETTGLPVAIGISGLKGIIKSLSNGIDAAYLGVQGQNATAEIAQAYDMPAGIYVTRVIMDSPAYLAGLRAGDIIVAGGETDLLTTQKLQNFLEDYSTGDVITLRAYRGGQDEYVEMEFEVTLGAR